jgi:hypothetical protein
MTAQITRIAADRFELAVDAFVIDPADAEDFELNELITVTISNDPADADDCELCSMLDDAEPSLPALIVDPYSCSPAGPDGYITLCLAHLPADTISAITAS